ncbi:MAG: methyltransferase domain-containing protein [Candidatus Omnitrophota bacterium]
MKKFDADKVKKANIVIFDEMCSKYDRLRRVTFSTDVFKSELSKIGSLFTNKYQNNQRFLSVGCGTGSVVLNLVLNRDIKEPYGIDISLGMLEKCRENAIRLGINMRFVKGDAENLPYKDNSFGFIIVHGILHHLPNYEKCICDCYRSLKIGGFCLIIEPSLKANKIIAILRWITWSVFLLYKRLSKSESEKLIDIRTFGFREMEEKCHDAGFSSVRIERFSGFSSRIFYWLTDPIAQRTTNKLIHLFINKIISILNILDNKMFSRIIPQEWFDEFIVVLKK